MSVLSSANPPSAPSTAATPPTAPQDFKTHAHMSRLFMKYKAKNWPTGGKTPDQFENLAYYAYVQPTGQVGGSRPSKAPGTKKQKVTNIESAGLSAPFGTPTPAAPSGSSSLGM